MASGNFPKQSVADSVKNTAKWKEGCVDGAISLAVNNSYSDSDQREININFDLYKNRLHMDDMLKSINKDGLLGRSFPDQIENHPIMAPKIALLVGESIKRRFDFSVASSSPNIITEKDQAVKRKIMDRLAELANPEETPDMSKADIEQEIKRLSRWKKYGYRDIREVTVTNLLNYYFEEQNLATKFSRGITSAIISNREIYDIDIYDGKLVVEQIDPRTLRYVLSPGEMDIEKADIIVHSTYLTPGDIIDRYYDSLTKAQIDDIEDSTTTPERKGSPKFMYTPTVDFGTDEVLEFNEFDNFGQLINGSGEIRVDKVRWKSRRKVGKVKFTNEDDEEDVKLVAEQYKVNKDLGETVKWFWINEWWEGVKVLDHYIKVRPRPIQFRGVDNISLSGPGIVGTVYPGDSMVSKAKPYQYMYNIISYKLQRTIAKYKGPMIELDLAKVPEGWDMTKWLKIGDETGYLPIDSFKEGNRGASTGKLAGNYNNSGKEYSQNMGNVFNDMFGFMNYLSEEMGGIIGVSKQREGEVGGRESGVSVGHAVTQSSHTTEELFHYHDYTKLKVLKAIVETAKYLYKSKKSQVLQYLVDESSIEAFDVDGRLINESDYSIMISNSQNVVELMNSFKQLAPEGIKAGKFNFSNIMDIYLSKSLAETRRTIETFEDEANERERKANEAQQKAIEAQEAKAEARELRKEELEKYKIDEDNETKIEIKKMDVEVEEKKIESSEDDEITKTFF